MELPSLLCRVQALYSFNSNESSSLQFEKGDLIEVLTQLPSGWWDGLCHGNRGWFPSNYVQVMEEYSNSSGTELVIATATPTEAQKSLGTTVPKRINKATVNLFDDKVENNSRNNSVTDSKHTSLPPNWSIQYREDGSASYFLNTITGEMRSTYPYGDSTSSYCDESDEDSTSSTIDSNNSKPDFALVNYNSSNNQSIATTDEVNINSEGPTSIGKWIQRTTTQGLPFFYNLSTHETAWHADSHDPKLHQQKDELQRLKPQIQQQQPQQKQPPSQQHRQQKKFDLRPSPLFDNDREPLTWSKLLIHVTLTINNLIASAKSSERSLYKKYAATVVDAVRFMLVASGTISKESLHIKTSGILRSHHRAMMASMSKLVLSSQLCSDGTVTDVTKLLSDCHELLVAVRNVISTCENIPVDLTDVDPVMIDSTAALLLAKRDSSSAASSSIIDQGVRAKYDLQADLIESLDTYGASMQESMASLMANLNRHSDSRSSLAVLLFTQYRNFGNQNGQFLSIIEDIDFDGVIHLPIMKDLAASKQKLYDGLGLLFFKMQAMTDDTIPMEQVVQEMQNAAQNTIDSIRLICDTITEMVAEKSKLISNNSSEEKYSNSNRSSSILDSTTSNSSTSTHDHSLSDFLKESNGSFDLNLIHKNSSSSHEDLYIKRSKNSKSLVVDIVPTNSLSTKFSNRASAPVSDHHNTTSPLIGEHIKARAQTFTDAQSKQTSAKLKQFFGDDLLDAVPTSPISQTAPENASNSLVAKNRSSSSTTTTSPTLTLAAAAAAASASGQEDEQRYLQYDYSPNEIVFTLDGNVKGGTLPALVERMTLHDYLDMNFNNTFLLTYRSFCTSMELLELLEARYNIQPPEELTPEELEIWTAKKQKLIRLRVFNVLKIWLEQYYYEEDSVILDRLLFFTNTTIKDTLSFSAYQLERLIHKRKEACKDLKKMVITQQADCPDSILPRNLKKFRLMDLDPTEMARQMTIMDFKLYTSIKSVECLDKAWSRDVSSSVASTGGVVVARNIQASIDYCNQITTWVSEEILSQSEVKKRSTIIKYWVNVAERCRMLNNFNTCMAILSAFDNSAVGRLKRTWEMVGARTNHVVAQIRKLMGANRNFNQYRALIHSVNPPCIPFLGIYLQDLTFIEDGNPNFLKTSKDLINFAKRAKTAEVIREIQQYQSMGYQLRSVEEIQNFILDSLRNSRDEDQLYKESLKLEPKERDDEKITRLLQESGFL